MIPTFADKVGQACRADEQGSSFANDEQIIITQVTWLDGEVINTIVSCSVEMKY